VRKSKEREREREKEVHCAISKSRSFLRQRWKKEEVLKEVFFSSSSNTSAARSAFRPSSSDLLPFDRLLPLLNFPSAAEAAAAAAARSASNPYRGVSWLEDRQQWRASIWAEGVNVNLGDFTDPEDAAKRYDDEARRLRGDKAELNFPREGEKGPARPGGAEPRPPRERV
jgi:hypothetical protein